MVACDCRFAVAGFSEFLYRASFCRRAIAENTLGREHSISMSRLALRSAVD